MRETAKNTALHNEDIEGVGVMFEPFSFQKDMPDFAFYVDKANVDAKIQPFGVYSDYSQEIYYQAAAQEKITVVTDPYEYNGVTMVSYATPILHQGSLKGVVMADINVNNFSKVNATNAKYPSMYATIYDHAETIIYDSEDSEDIGKSLANFTPNQGDLAAIRAGMQDEAAFEVETTREDGRKITRYFTPITVGNETWWSQTALNSADIQRSVVRTVSWLLAISVGSLLLIIASVLLVLNKMLRPIGGVVEAAQNIVDGNLDIHLQISSGDEIGTLSRAFERMAGNLKAIILDIDRQLNAMGSGDFCTLSGEEERYVGDYRGMLDAMTRINQNLTGTLQQISQSADQVSSGSEQVSSGAQALSQGATEQASSVEELAATITEISGQVQHNAESAHEASQKSAQVGRQAQESNQRMQAMLSAMSEISGSSSQIGKIIKTIEDIAFQTNILALNAAVEAARAGAAGKGFAVVADEVRNLASKSAEASKSTAALIAGSLSAVDNGTKIAGQTAQALAGVISGVNAVAETLEKISAASDQQASSISQVTQGIDQISSVVQTNSATAEESAAASEELSGQAQMLKDLVGKFRLRDDGKTSDPQQDWDSAQEQDEPVATGSAGKY